MAFSRTSSAPASMHISRNSAQSPKMFANAHTDCSATVTHICINQSKKDIPTRSLPLAKCWRMRGRTFKSVMARTNCDSDESMFVRHHIASKTVNSLQINQSKQSINRNKLVNGEQLRDNSTESGIEHLLEWWAFGATQNGAQRSNDAVQLIHRRLAHRRHDAHDLLQRQRLRRRLHGDEDGHHKGELTLTCCTVTVALVLSSSADKSSSMILRRFISKSSVFFLRNSKLHSARRRRAS